MKFCSSCGRQSEDTAQFCESCGKEFSSVGAVPPPAQATPAQHTTYQGTPLETNRSYGLLVLLTFLTFGIYAIVMFSKWGEDVNKICREDGKKTMPYWQALLLGLVTFGIMPVVWLCSVVNRCVDAGRRFGVQVHSLGKIIGIAFGGGVLAGIGAVVGSLVFSTSLVDSMMSGSFSQSDMILQGFLLPMLFTIPGMVMMFYGIGLFVKNINILSTVYNERLQGTIIDAPAAGTAPVAQAYVSTPKPPRDYRKLGGGLLAMVIATGVLLVLSVLYNLFSPYSLTYYMTNYIGISIQAVSIMQFLLTLQIAVFGAGLFALLKKNLPLLRLMPFAIGFWSVLPVAAALPYMHSAGSGWRNLIFLLTIFVPLILGIVWFVMGRKSRELRTYLGADAYLPPKMKNKPEPFVPDEEGAETPRSKNLLLTCGAAVLAVSLILLTVVPPVYQQKQNEVSVMRNHWYYRYFDEDTFTFDENANYQGFSFVQPLTPSDEENANEFWSFATDDERAKAQELDAKVNKTTNAKKIAGYQNEYEALYLEIMKRIEDAFKTEREKALAQNDTEARLRAAFEKECDDYIIKFMYGDFDGDGKYEAFVAAGAEPDCTIYFVSGDGIEVLRESLYGEPANSVTAGKNTFFVWEQHAGGSGSTSFIFGVKGRRPYEPQISGKCMMFAKEGSEFTSQADNFPESRYKTVTYRFDASTLEFVGNGQDTASNNNGTEYIVVTEDNANLNLRAAANTSAKILAVIPYNTVLTVISVQAGWGLTEYGGQTGWVSMEFLEEY